MSANKLYPTVEEFKHFMNTRPELVLEMRKSGRSLQDYYNRWVEHGEDESAWSSDEKESRGTNKNYKDLFNQIVKYTENIDVNIIQGHVKQFNKVLDTVQLLLNDFIGEKNATTDSGKQSELFNLFRD